MKRLRLAAAGLALSLLALPVTAAAAVQLRGLDASSYPTIHASVVLPQGASDEPIIAEDGHSVAGLQLQNLGHIKAVSVLIDRSQSMRGAPLADASKAARAFVAVKQPADEFSVVAFGSAPSTLSPFSTTKGDADAALASVKPDAARGTALYDAVIVAARQLSSNPLPGRVIIVLTDGADNASRHDSAAAVAAARHASAAVYAIGIEGSGFTAAPLVEIAAKTGGQYYRARSTSALAGVYGQIAATLKRTWRIQYVTAARPGDRLRLTASVVGQGSVAQTLALSDAGSAQPAAPSKLVPKGAYGPGGPLGIAVLVAVLVLLAALFFLTGMRGSWVRTRIAVHVGETKQVSKTMRKEKRLQMLASVFRGTEKALGDLKQWRWLSNALERADVPLKTVEFFWIEVAAVVGIAMFATLLRVAPAITVVLMAVAGMIPFSVIWLKMRKRLRAFEDQLPDLLATIAASLKAGHSFKQGLQAVADEDQPPASAEIKRVLTEVSLGRPMDDALAEMSVRLGSKNFEFAITAVTIQRQVGGSLAVLFDMVAETVRQRQQFARKIRALTAMGRMSAYTLIGIPFFIATMLTLINREYMSPLYTTSRGHLLIGITLVMMTIGSLILKKIVSFRG
jgi:tight adherence protein B